MKFCAMIAMLAVVACAAAEDMTFMEKAIPRATFVKQTKSNPDTVHELVFAVKQNNLDKLHNTLMDISSPQSKKYQKWLTYDQVGALTANPEATTKIEAWLKASGATVTTKTQRGEYIRAEATIGQWEALLNAEFYNWQDTTQIEGRQMVDRATEYSIPSSISEYVHGVFKSVQTPPMNKPKFHKKVREGKGLPSKQQTEETLKTSLRVNIDKDAKKVKKNSKEASPDAQGVVTVSFLDSYYSVPSSAGSSALSQSVFETSSEYFSPGDLADFQNDFSLPVQAAVVQDGFDTTNCVSNDCYEGNLDVQYIMGTAQNLVTIYWYVSGNDPFVDYLVDIADTADPPQANSISWGSVEQLNSATEMNAFNTEALKLTSMGVTITVSSGDDGAPNLETSCMCTRNSGSSEADWTGTNTWTGEGYFPSFPASSPYVTALGATQGPESGDPEIVCQSSQDGIITSGGGFSTFYPQPSWQTDAVNAYFAGLDSSNTPTSGYNALGRGYPDVSMIGVWYEVYVQGQIVDLFGTSASSPVFAAMISLVNSQRYNLSLPAVGFVNPTLYQLGSNATFRALANANFNDVTDGDNKCCASSYGDPTCCDSGFTATVGWDPTTGWGSIDYPDLYNIFAVSGGGIVTTDDNGGDKTDDNAGSNSGGSNNNDDDNKLDDSAVAGIVIVCVLVAVIIVMLAVWQPWKSKDAGLASKTEMQTTPVGTAPATGNPLARANTFTGQTPGAEGDM